MKKKPANVPKPPQTKNKNRKLVSYETLCIAVVILFLSNFFFAGLALWMKSEVVQLWRQLRIYYELESQQTLNK